MAGSADTLGMSRGFFFVVVCVSLAACHTDLQGPAGGGEASPEQLGGPAGLATEPVAAPASVRDADTDEQDTDAQDGDDEQRRERALHAARRVADVRGADEREEREEETTAVVLEHSVTP